MSFCNKKNGKIKNIFIVIVIVIVIIIKNTTSVINRMLALLNQMLHTLIYMQTLYQHPHTTPPGLLFHNLG